jgi:hypothetical protein
MRLPVFDDDMRIKKWSRAEWFSVLKLLYHAVNSTFNGGRGGRGAA